ncbi:MerR family transcriptional regulator [Fodinicola acaciae]|uniref:MerR family transcriptional regulator n=1 Tax=Fodinicola acaciae TaxID=2681555 RepID=UPI0013D7707D|nr:MerR family transcriptional regulator [Fodinicola acaciae]
MTNDTLMSIGDLARLARVPVRTIRFYCDEGVLPCVRSAGGHRKFESAAVEQLNLVRQLRSLGLGLAAITDVLVGERSVSDVVAAERATLDVELASLAWRRAALTAVETAGAERPARLELLAMVENSRAAHQVLVDFWRRQAIASFPVETVDDFVAMTVPEPPSDPTVGQVVAYAEMVSLAGDRSFLRQRLAHAQANRTAERALLAGISEACQLAEPYVVAGRAAGPGEPLDRFVDIHAAVLRERDTLSFRRWLSAHYAFERDPRIRRYWTLAGRVAGVAVFPGAMHSWLVDALEVATA